LGRGITDADENPGAPRAMVISYVYWTRRFARDPSIIGKSVTLNGIHRRAACLLHPRTPRDEGRSHGGAQI